MQTFVQTFVWTSVPLRALPYLSRVLTCVVLASDGVLCCAARSTGLGHIHLDVGIAPAGGGLFTLTARVIGAQGLTVQDMNGYSDPYTELCLITPGVKEKKGDKKKTKVVKKNLSPEWNETITFTGITAASLTTLSLPAPPSRPYQESAQVEEGGPVSDLSVQ